MLLGALPSTAFDQRGPPVKHRVAVLLFALLAATVFAAAPPVFAAVPPARAALPPARAALPPARAAAAPVRIMPLGDSITAGPGCWRAQVRARPPTSRYTQPHLVGTPSHRGGGQPRPPGPNAHAGHRGCAAPGDPGHDPSPPPA